MLEYSINTAPGTKRIKNVTAPGYTLGASDVGAILLCDTSGGNVTITLPGVVSTDFPLYAEVTIVSLIIPATTNFVYVAVDNNSIIEYADLGTFGREKDHYPLPGTFSSIELVAGRSAHIIKTKNYAGGGTKAYYQELMLSQLDRFSETFAGSLTGYASPLATSVAVRRVSSLVTLTVAGGGYSLGTSNSTAMTLTGLPSYYWPSVTRKVPVLLQDNGVQKGGWANIDASTGTITFNLGFDGGTLFTASGSKGLPSTFILTYTQDSL